MDSERDISEAAASGTPPSVVETTTSDSCATRTWAASASSLKISPTGTHPSAASTGSAIAQKPEVGHDELSTSRLLMAHFGAALMLFLATTDANIVSTSLPTISSDLDMSQTQYTWVVVAYLLTQTAFQPLYGRCSDIVGRKATLFTSGAIVALGSLLCGLSTSITMLLVFRALTGVGGGGIVASVWVVTSEIVPVESRAIWSQALSITWSCSAVAGPLLGGLFSGHAGSKLSWRWGFYINLPVCLVASVILLVSLRDVNLQRSANSSWRTIKERFDFGGLFLFMGGTTLIIVGFSFANDNGWNSVTTVSTLTVGTLTIICAGVYESWTTRDCLFPPSLFTNSTAVSILVIVFLHNFAFNAGIFYLALYFQAVEGYTPLEAGMQILPFSLGSSLASMPAAWFMSYWQQRHKDLSGQNLIISVGLLVSAVGYGLLALLNSKASRAEQVAYPLVAGIGLGLLLHAPYQVFVRTMKPEELATGTSAFFLVRFTGATVGLAVAGAIMYARASQLLPPGLAGDITKSLKDVSSIEPLQVRLEVVEAFTTSIQNIWFVCAPSLGVSFLISLLVRPLPVECESSVEEKSRTGTAV